MKFQRTNFVSAQWDYHNNNGFLCTVLLYPGVDGKKSGDIGVTERLGLLRDAGSRLMWTLKN